MRAIDADAFKEQLESAYEYTELSEVIEMLDNAPTVERPQGERAERALAIIDRLRTDGHINNKEQGTLRRAILLPERSQGEWVTDERGYVCSECGALHSDDYPFCHMCGADMRGGRE